ncbi:hypothetical protein BDV26DRAFT_266914 [Aspergillus bertholletiae]|uniref:Uncharacterized protein n=1 Tax=Aspergillus bertholletiae TaxID=1226010 RepID=A0A5N7B1A5_9EURO|nr:hypothetical protein BDV26DRAFT_266914 [Aspergillus bertholletiae]
MTPHTINPALLSSSHKDPVNTPPSSTVSEISTTPSSESSEGERKQESGEIRTRGSRARHDARLNMYSVNPDALSGQYFCPVISAISDRTALPEHENKNIISQLRVTEDESRLFAGLGESAAAYPSDASKPAAVPITEETSPMSRDILHNLRITDEERHFLQGLRGNI